MKVFEYENVVIKLGKNAKENMLLCQNQNQLVRGFN